MSSLFDNQCCSSAIHFCFHYSPFLLSSPTHRRSRCTSNRLAGAQERCQIQVRTRPLRVQSQLHHISPADYGAETSYRYESCTGPFSTQIGLICNVNLDALRMHPCLTARAPAIGALSFLRQCLIGEYSK